MLYSLSFKHDLTKYATDAIVIDTTSNSRTDGKWFSPFFLGPVACYDGYIATSIENSYQFAKLYSEYMDQNGDPLPSYWEWAQRGWSNPKPIKHPLGAWRTAPYHIWKGKRLSRVEAQNEIFVTAYVELVTKTKAFDRLKALFERTKRDIILLAYEGYDHRYLDLSWDEVFNHPEFAIGQNAVLHAMLEGYLKY